MNKTNCSRYVNKTHRLAPSGWQANNEPPEVAIKREILEEIGCESEIKQFVGRFETAAANEPDHLLVSYVYEVELKQHRILQLKLRR